MKDVESDTQAHTHKCRQNLPSHKYITTLTQTHTHAHSSSTHTARKAKAQQELRSKSASLLLLLPPLALWSICLFSLCRGARLELRLHSSSSTPCLACSSVGLGRPGWSAWIAELGTGYTGMSAYVCVHVCVLGTPVYLALHTHTNTRLRSWSCFWTRLSVASLPPSLSLSICVSAKPVSACMCVCVCGTLCKQSLSSAAADAVSAKLVITIVKVC